MRVRERINWEAETTQARATYYALYLRLVERLPPTEAAALVLRRYPAAAPVAERFTRPPVIDPLAQRKEGLG